MAYSEEGCGPLAEKIRGTRSRTVADAKAVRDNSNVGSKKPQETKFPNEWRQKTGTPRMY